jgi:hypothetical protein
MFERQRVLDEDVGRSPPSQDAPVPAAHVVLALQRSAGNQAVARRLIQRVTASTASAAAHQRALEAHAADRIALANALKAGVNSTDERLRNSAMWILEGKSSLYALTPTADSEARATTANQSGMRALFGYPTNDKFTTNPVGGHVLDSTVATYVHHDMERNDEVVFDSPDSAGFRSPSGKKICVVEPARIDAINALRTQLQKTGQFPSIAETLKHETQHEADWDFGQESISAHSDADVALLEYRTEFRAYTAQEADWLHEPPPTGEAEKYGITNPVQLQIFLQIYKGYTRVKAAWDGDLELRKGGKFRERVRETQGGIESISANPYNSPRVDDFLIQVREVSRARPYNEQRSLELVSVLRRFDARDRETIVTSHFYPFDDLKDWVKKLVGELLKDPKANVEPLLKAEQKRGEEQANAELTKPLSQAPGHSTLLKAFTNWAAVRECLGMVKTRKGVPALEDEEVKDELKSWANEKDAFVENFAYFVGNLLHSIDWRTVFTQRGVKV